MVTRILERVRLNSASGNRSSFDAHLYFIDFRNYTDTAKNPIYFSSIRDPIARFVSKFFYARWNSGHHYREVQLDFTPVMEVFFIFHAKNRKRSLRQHKKYFNFRSKIQLDHPVQQTRGVQLQLRARHERRGVALQGHQPVRPHGGP